VKGNDSNEDIAAWEGMKTSDMVTIWVNMEMSFPSSSLPSKVID
jgi:hypothetical protein